MADAGVFFLTISGGEIFLRPDPFDILAHARGLMFSVKIKTNAILIREEQARAVDAGLRKIVRAHRPGIGESAVQEGRHQPSAVKPRH
jgi:MoaA/NifB/PqqE/SkfB family radical SAM enzyme